MLFVIVAKSKSLAGFQSSLSFFFNSWAPKCAFMVMVIIGDLNR